MDVFVNSWLVAGGYATSYSVQPNTQHTAEFNSNEEMAKMNQEGCLWAPTKSDYIRDKCFSITNFHFNAAGNDNYNLDDEYVTLKNSCPYDIDMTSWSIKDQTTRNVYSFPSFDLQSGATITLFTGMGTDTSSQLYWGRASGDYAAVWNNGGDTLYLRDSGGDIVLSQAYTGYS